MSKLNRMERRIQGFKEKVSAMAMGWKKAPFGPFQSHRITRMYRD